MELLIYDGGLSYENADSFLEQFPISVEALIFRFKNWNIQRLYHRYSAPPTDTGGVAFVP